MEWMFPQWWLGPSYGTPYGLSTWPRGDALAPPATPDPADTPGHGPPPPHPPPRHADPGGRPGPPPPPRLPAPQRRRPVADPARLRDGRRRDRLHPLWRHPAPPG